MSPNPPDALTVHFGIDGLRQYPGVESGLPVQVGNYFVAPPPDGPWTLTDHAAEEDLPAPESSLANRLRLGGDRGAEIYLAGDSSVRAVLLGLDWPEKPVNSNLAAFAAGLLALDMALSRIHAAEDQDEALAAYRDLRAYLLDIDPAAFEDRESWWPLVLDDIRQPINVPASAAFEFTDQDGTKQIMTATSRPGQPHPEELIWQQLSGAGAPRGAVTRVFTELAPCMLPGHYCALWLGQEFPDAEFTHQFEYGSTSESRERGVQALMLHVA
jgi:hypothetical protein